MFLAGFGLSQTSLHLFVLEEVVMKHVLKVIKCLEWRCSSSAVGLWGFSNWIPHFLFYYAYFPHQCFFCLHILYLFLSVLIVISGDVVHSPLWDRYSKISAENPERSFTQSQYKHEWKCVCSACVCLTIPQNHLTWKNVFIWNWLYWLYWYIQSCPYWLWWIHFEFSFWCMYCRQSDLHDWLQSSQLTGACRFKWNVQCVFQKMLMYSDKLWFWSQWVV